MATAADALERGELLGAELELVKGLIFHAGDDFMGRWRTSSELYQRLLELVSGGAS